MPGARPATRPASPAARGTHEPTAQEPTAPPPAPLPFEQRSSPRRSVRGRLTATFCDPDGRPILTRVELADFSETGLGVIAPLAAQAGSMIELHDGPRAVYAGTVARCRASVGGHVVGVRLVGMARAA